MGMFALLIIALSVVGFTYATWSDKVLIDGTAEMGDLLLGFEVGTEACYANELGKLPPAPADTHLWYTVPTILKDVSTCTVVGSIPETSDHTGKTVNKKLTITAEDAYPSLFIAVRVNLHNGGTTPIHIKSVTITPTSADLLWDEAQKCFWKDFDLSGTKEANEIIMNFEICKEDPFTDPLPSNQIDPCECLWIWIFMHFKEYAEECHTYTFTVEIEGIQWNKVP